MHYWRLIRAFFKASLQQETAYSANFAVGLLHSLLNLGTGLMGVLVIFGQVEVVRGWDFASALAVLGVYLTVGALRSLFISPSLDALTGMDGEVWDGRFDFTLLRPVDTQFCASLRHWRFFALFDLVLGGGVLVTAAIRLGATLNTVDVVVFLITLGSGVLILYAILLAFAGLVFWSPGFLFSWVFDGIFQMARYPIELYPGAFRLILTWVVPVGLITTVPAEALAGRLASTTVAGSVLVAVVMTLGASLLFRSGLRRYASASS